MNLQRMTCPGCGASITIPDDLAQLTCTFCGSSLRVQRGEGYAALQLAEKLEQAIQESSSQTQDTIRAQTAATQGELRRLQLSQELATGQLQLANVQTELRSLERERATVTTRRQRRNLHQQEGALQARIAALSAALSSAGQPLAVDAVLPPARSRAGKKPWYRSLGCLIVLLLFFPPAWAVLLLTDPEQHKAVKLIALAVLVVYTIAILANLVARPG
jgi:uncharacterized Zn finger protein (UPF0148 family)